jgi:hypothetical protein
MPPDVIECEATPFEARREASQARRLAPWVVVLVLMFPVLALLLMFRLAAVVLGAALAFARHPVGMASLAALLVWGWFSWRDRRSRQRS